MIKKTILLLTLLLPMLSFASEGEIVLEEPIIKSVPPGAKNSAAFLKIRNLEKEEIRLISASSPVSKAVEIHTMEMSGGMMKMRRIEEVPIKPNGEVELKPGGYHLMLIGLSAPLKSGETKNITLVFSNGKKLTREFQIKDLDAPEADHSHHNHDSHGSHAGHEMHHRADAVSPAGIMAPHMHEVGKWMIDYRYMGMNMYGLMSGKKYQDEYATMYFEQYEPSVQMPSGSLITRSPSSAIWPEMNPNGYRYMSVPKDMIMEMHMASVMTNITENFMIMFMVPVVKNSMTMLSSNFDKAPMTSGGVGDVSFSGAYRFLNKGNHSLFWGMGLFLPTGSTDEKDWMPMMGKQKVPYNMQPGTGSYGIQPQFSYTGGFKRVSWGMLSQATLRLGKNENGYRVGNRYEGTTWLAVSFFDSWSISTRLHKQQWLNITGSDTGLDPKMDPQNDPNKQGGIRTDAYLGINFLVTGGLFQGLRFGAEGGAPIQQSLNGPQMAVRQLLNLFVNYSF